MRILVTGPGGMLGTVICEEVEHRGHLLIRAGRDRLDLDAPEEGAALIRAENPDWVIHTAADTDVDGCQARPSECLQRNGHAVGILADGARDVDARFLTISSDYVFDGQLGRPYREDDRIAPLGVYGRSKAEGESAALALGATVARLSWLFGPSGKNFVATIAGKLREGLELKVVDDQRGSPTYTRDAATAILDLTEAGASGIYHVCNSGEASWFDLAAAIADRLGISSDRVRPCSSAQYPRPAPRPADTRMATDAMTRIIGRSLPTWTDALTRYMEEEGWLAK